MQTELDGQVVAWVGRVGAATADQVAARFGMGRSWCYERLASLTRAELLAHTMLLHGRPGLYTTTREGLRWQRLERLGVQHLSPATANHAETVTRVAVELETRLGRLGVLSERELRVAEVDGERPIAAVVVGQLPGGRPALHRPDLALIDGRGSVVAVEVELSVKAPRRLRLICRSYARARHIEHVHYIADRAPGRAVARAIDHVRAEDRITVHELADTASLSERIDRDV